jgi:hypothetical protein
MKACPFCGGKASFRTASHGLWWIACDACYAETRGAETKVKAQEIWDRRKPAPRAEPGALLDGAEAIRRERERQKTVEGWSSKHDDDEHTGGELAQAAAAYAVGDARLYPRSWSLLWWKVPRTPNGTIDRKREVEKAGALLAAEWDRLARAALGKEGEV